MKETYHLYQKEIKSKQKLFIWSAIAQCLFFFLFIVWNNMDIILGSIIGIVIIYFSCLFLNLTLKIETNTVKEIKNNKKLKKYLLNKTNKKLKDITLSDLKGTNNEKN